MTNEGSANAEHRPISIGRYAEVMAHLRHFPRDKAEVLLRLGLTETRWQALVHAFTQAMADESAREEEELSKAFGAAYLRTSQRLKQEKPDLAAIGPLPGDPPAAPEEAELAEEPPAAPIKKEDAARAAVPTYLAAKPPAIQNAAAVSPDIIPPGMRHFTDVRATHAAPADPPAGPTLPFQPKDVTGSARAVERAIAHADTVQGPRRPSGPASLGAMTGDISEAVKARPALPFDDASGPGAPPLSLEQYASLHVEATLEPAKLPEILRRYRITSEQRAALDLYWQRRIATDSGVRAAWESACDTYRRWLAEHQGKKP